ncbi:MAG TPA: metallophosphoesterase [Candidatus Anammoximicrobium sp.]|nr:metallophosphoesterase [Candidatus Anammoximicrobium sp.]
MKRNSQASSDRRTGRRDFLLQTGCLLAGAGIGCLTRESAAADSEDPAVPLLRIGLLTDLHYADKPAAGSRHYRDSRAKLAAAGKRFAEAKTDLVIQLGDSVDTATSLEAEKEALRNIHAEFAAIPAPRHYVLGNHCVSALTKADFLEIVGQPKSFYSFDLNQHHIVILDACFRSDGVAYGGVKFDWGDANVPPEEIEWLRNDLQQTSLATIVFVHQRLDVAPPYGVKNAPELRRILEESKRVLAVFQGHDHRGDVRVINGIHYCTLRAMVEGAGLDNNAFAILDVLPGGELRLTGFGKQPSYRW